jgi:hypothetical protein
VTGSARIIGRWLAGLSLAIACDARAQVDLTRDAAWEYRAVSGTRAHPWTADPNEAVASLGAAPAAPAWPGTWRTFTPWEPNAATSRPCDDPASFTSVPLAVTLNGISACRATLTLYGRGILDLTVGQGEPRPGRWAYAFAELKSPGDQDVTFHVVACAPLTWWLDGKQVLHAVNAGEYAFPVRLTKGPHVCAAKVDSAPREWNLSGRIVAAGPAPVVEARCLFEPNQPGRFMSLTFVGPLAQQAAINGQPLQSPVFALRCQQVAALSPTILKPGRNTISQALTPVEAAGGLGGGKLLGLSPEEAAIQWGPVITRATDAAATILCRTNAPVSAVLRLDGRQFTSPAGLIHRWQVDGLKPGAAYPYSVAPGRGTPRGGTLRTLPADGGAVTIALAGDPQSALPWRDVAAAIARARPDVCVILGDLVGDGLSDELWGRTFFQPAADLLAGTACRAIMGNHDRRSPVIDGFLLDGGLNWAQDIGEALLIGIDGGGDWSPAGDNAKWLDGVLANRKARFVFVATHYPAYSSRNHGKLADDGAVLERPGRATRTRIVPILERHRVTAIFDGHDHGYERSELPSGLTAVVTGGAGAGAYEKRGDATRQNPYSKVFAEQHHYSLVRIDGDTATLTAVTPDGEVLDARTWTAARRASPATRPASSPQQAER